MKGRLVESRSWNDVEENEKVRFFGVSNVCVLFDLYNGGALLGLSLGR